MIEEIRKPDGTYISATVNYSYDDAYRLTEEDRTGSYAYLKRYTYDANGNRETMVDGSGTTYYHYDMASKVKDYGSSDTYPYTGNTTIDYDGAGNTEFIRPPGSSPVVTTYIWDWNDKLASVKEGTTTIAQFAYDGDGTRTSATFGSGTAQFLYDGSRLIAELDSQGAITAFYTIGPDGTISRLVASGGPIFYHGDGLASVKAITGSTPVTVTDTYAYDAWGDRLTPPSGMGQPYQFVGGVGYYTHYQEEDFNLLQLGARYYSPSIGRFLSHDPAGDGLNPYEYASENPINDVDPSGLGNAKWPRNSQICNDSDKCVIVFNDRQYTILWPGQCTHSTEDRGDFGYFDGFWYKCEGKPWACHVKNDGQTGFIPPPPNQRPNPPDSLCWIYCKCQGRSKHACPLEENFEDCMKRCTSGGKRWPGPGKKGR